MSGMRKTGQTVLITVLVLTIALTVALSLMRRTITDIKTTGQLEESARAFSVAEAGIEDVLKRGSGSTATIQSGGETATFTTTYIPIAGSTGVFTYPTSTEKGDVATVWLVNHNDDGTLEEAGTNYYCKEAAPCTIEICWEQPATPATIPAIEVGTLYKTTAGAYGLDRVAIDPDAARLGNNFTRGTAVGTGCSGKTNVYTTTVTLPTTNARPLALRLRPYYNQTVFSVAPVSGRTLSPQGFEVSSTGKTGSGITRKIVVKKKFDAPASVFDYVLYSNTTITNDIYQP